MMIIRPVPIATWVSRGYSLSAAVARFDRASGRISSYTIRRYADVGEFVTRIPSGYNENSFSINLMGTGDYEYAIPNWRIYPVTTPNDPQFPQQWHHATVKSALAWNISTGSNQITVAICDTGVDITHPDLQASMVKGFNAPTRTAEVDGGQILDINGHGTHVAGDAAAIGNNATGVTGMGWNMKIMPIRVTDDPSGGANFDDMMAGARWAADHGAKAINSSYSGVDDPAVQTTGAYCKTKGALYLYAAGNDNRNLTGFSHKDVIVAGASNEQDQKAGFSAYGKGTSVFAPGTNILSSTNGGGYGPASGTSMACPVTTGAVGMIWSVNPALTPDQVQNILYTNCDDIGPSSIFSHGRINQFKNLTAANLTLLIGSDVNPSGVAVIKGTKTAGDLISLNTIDANLFKISSQTDPSLTYVGGLECKFSIGATTKLVTVTPMITYTLGSNPNPTIFIFAKKYSTGQNVYLGATRASALANAQFKLSMVKSEWSKYVSSTNEMTFTFRIHSQSQRGGTQGAPFSMQMNQFILHLEKQQ